MKLSYRYTVFNRDGEIIARTDDKDEVNRLVYEHGLPDDTFGERVRLSTLAIVEFSGDDFSPPFTAFTIFGGATGGHWPDQKEQESKGARNEI